MGMGAKEKNGPALLGLRNGAGKILAGLPFSSRFSAKAPTPTAPSANSAFAAMDPTVALFPGDSEEPKAPAASLSLAERLRQSADGVSQRDRALFDIAADLSAVSDSRSEGEKAVYVWTVRLFIGCFLMFMWFRMQYKAALASDGGAAVVRDAPIDHYITIANVFGGIGLLLAAAALCMLILIFSLGNATNGKLRRAGREAGAKLAASSRAFSEELEQYRNIITDPHKSAVDILPVVSQAHLSALAAKLYFRRISFLTESETAEANRFGDTDSHFSRFLALGGGGAGGVSLTSFMLWVTIAYVAGAGTTYYVLPQLAEGGLPSIAAVVDYDWAWQPLFVALTVYALTGLLVSLLFGLISAGELSRARAQALDAVRSAYLKAGGPTSANITEKVDNAVDVLRGRLTGQGARRTNHAGADYTANSAETDEPEWRRRDSSVKFIDAGFSPAPESWRTDAFAKKFEAHSMRGSEAKRGGEGAKKRGRD